MRLAALAAAAAAASVTALLVTHLVAPQSSGPLALTLIVEPYLVLAGLLAVLVALRSPGRWAVAFGVVLIAFAAFRYGPTFVSLPTAAASSGALDVIAWNILAGRDDGQRLREGLAGFEADIVGLEELQHEGAAAIEADADLAARFPHRVLNPHASVLGMGLLSAHPIVEHEVWTDPPLIRAVVQPPDQAPLTVFVGHPLPARIDMLAGIPIGVDTHLRDRRIATIRQLIDRDLIAGRSVVVVGDFNVTHHEPGYALLATGLRDAHLEAGVGPGFTWRPLRLAGLPLGVLRIDYILASPDFAVGSSGVDCSEPSDHCRIGATIWRSVEE